MEYKVTSPTNIVSDPVLPLLAGKCLSSDNSTSPPGQLRARVYVKLDLDGLSWMGVYPSFSQEVQSPCSMSGSEVLKGLTGGGNNLLGSLLSGLPN